MIKQWGVRDRWTRDVAACMQRTVGRRDGGSTWFRRVHTKFNTLNTELNPIYYFLALLGAHPILHISGVKVKFVVLLLE